MTPTDSDELTRKQRREQARAARKAAEEAERARAARRRRLSQIGGAVVALAAIAGIVIAIASGGGGSSTPQTTQPTAAGSLPGLQVGPAPWPAEYNHLAQRLQQLQIPAYGESMGSYHIHAHLYVYVNGKNITVPAQAGIDPQGQFLAPLHTHDATGVIHMESSQTYPFKLGQFFQIWGVQFSATQLGGYQAGNGNVLETWVNGKLVPDGPSYVLKPHDLVIVGFGKPSSFPHSQPYSFAAGL